MAQQDCVHYWKLDDAPEIVNEWWINLTEALIGGEAWGTCLYCEERKCFTPTLRIPRSIVLAGGMPYGAGRKFKS